MLRRGIQRSRRYAAAEYYESCQYVVRADPSGCLYGSQNGAHGILDVHGGGAVFPRDRVPCPAIQREVDEEGACVRMYMRSSGDLAGGNSQSDLVGSGEAVLLT